MKHLYCDTFFSHIAQPYVTHCSKFKPLVVQAGPLHCCVENVISVQEYISSCCPSNNELLADGNSKHERGWHRECVCVCKWESSGAGQPDLSLTSMFAPWSLSCEPSAANQSLIALFSYFYLLFLCSCFLIWYFFPLSLSHTYLSSILKVQQKGVWEKKNSVVLSTQACFVTQQCIPSFLLQQFCINFPAVSFLLFSHPNPSQHISQLRDVTHWLTCIHIPCSHTLNGKLHGSVYSSTPLTQNH